MADVDVVEVVARFDDHDLVEVVEVVARLDDTIVAVAHGPAITVGESGDIFAPASTTSFTLDALPSPIELRAGLLTITARRVPASTPRVPRKHFEGRLAAYIGISLLVHLALWGTSMRARGELGASRYALWLPIRTSGPPTLALPGEASDTPTISMSLAGDRVGDRVGVGDRIDDRVGVGDRVDDLVGDRVGDHDGYASVDIVTTDSSDDTEARRARAIASAQRAGILGADSLVGDRPLGDIPGTGEPAADFDGRAIHGGARGESVGASFGGHRGAGDSDGTGTISGDGTGTIGGDGTGAIGGDGTSTIAATGYATIGSTGHGVICGDEPERPCRYGTRGAGAGVGDHMRPRVAGVPTIRLCGSPDGRRSPCVQIAGELDKTIIRRYIRRKLPAITGCYEKQLLADGAFSGAVETSFLIDATGHVRDITATGMHPDVASCVATVISSIQFPLSDGGGSTQVHYPFSFIVAGG